MPSRFLPLVAGVASISEAAGRPADRANPVTAREAEAWLRRIVRDPHQPKTRRLAALSLLATGTEWGLRSPEAYARVRPRGPDDGIITEELTLSPSQAESYAACPRRYVFERRLQVGDEATPFLTFGSLIHRTLERAEASAVKAGTPHADLSTALEELDSVWDPSDYGGEPWATAWYRRAVHIVTHLYEHWPSRGVPIALERPLTLEVDGVPWRGKADRIEVEGGAIRVVDYKTGTRVPTTADAAVSMQLGFYVLALQADEGLPGSVDQAEFWFPARTESKTVTVRRFDAQQLDRAVQAMQAAARGIAAEQWPATPNPHCSNCRVRIVCPEWPEGKEAFSA
jgi:RecB family exonuclease